jgi:ComF family protein
VVNVLLTQVRRVFSVGCLLCGGSTGGDEASLRGSKADLCSACHDDLPKNFPCCDRCAEPLTASSSALVCGRCLQKRPRFDTATCAFRYEYPVDHLVRALKFHGRMAYGRVLGELLAHDLQSRRASASRSEAPLSWPEMIVPVPLAERRFRERGFNQAIEIGNALEHSLGVPLRADVAIRTRDTLEQAGLDSKARRRNLRRAFELTRKFKAKHVAIVDDVVTTGSTANELARVLKRAGVARVEVWAVARTVRS